MATNPSFAEHTEIVHAMKGIDFAVRPDEMVMRRLERIPDHDDDNIAHVMEAVGGGS